MNDTFSIDPDELSDIVDDLVRAEGTLSRLGEDIARQMAALQSQWQGLAADAQREAQEEWTTGMTAMHGALTELRGAADLAHPQLHRRGEPPTSRCGGRSSEARRRTLGLRQRRRRALRRQPGRRDRVHVAVRQARRARRDGRRRLDVGGLRGDVRRGRPRHRRRLRRPGRRPGHARHLDQRLRRQPPARQRRLGLQVAAAGLRRHRRPASGGPGRRRRLLPAVVARRRRRGPAGVLEPRGRPPRGLRLAERRHGQAARGRHRVEEHGQLDLASHLAVRHRSLRCSRRSVRPRCRWRAARSTT